MTSLISLGFFELFKFAGQFPKSNELVLKLDLYGYLNSWGSQAITYLIHFYHILFNFMEATIGAMVFLKQLVLFIFNHLGGFICQK